mmetsp:Transcript_12579/g.33477  ORF Transcript_12579/g.33477 Transcript_12579/m.33477 type:complete len:255 (+) Transcript_12579:730-1494(+)
MPNVQMEPAEVTVAECRHARRRGRRCSRMHLHQRGVRLSRRRRLQKTLQHGHRHLLREKHRLGRLQHRPEWRLLLLLLLLQKPLHHPMLKHPQRHLPPGTGHLPLHIPTLRGRHRLHMSHIKTQQARRLEKLPSATSCSISTARRCRRTTLHAFRRRCSSVRCDSVAWRYHQALKLRRCVLYSSRKSATSTRTTVPRLLRRCTGRRLRSARRMRSMTAIGVSSTPHGLFRMPRRTEMRTCYACLRATRENRCRC